MVKRAYYFAGNPVPTWGASLNSSAKMTKKGSGVDELR
jgi:hypothetical protein